MASPPSLKRLATESFEDADDWFKEMFLPLLNGFLGDVANALNRSLDGDNILREDREFIFTTGATVAIDAPPFPLFFTPQVAKQPHNLIITNNAVDGVSPIGAVQPVWDRTADGRVRLRLLTGLDANTRYKMRARFD